jgi:hypothetical protein
VFSECEKNFKNNSIAEDVGFAALAIVGGRGGRRMSANSSHSSNSSSSTTRRAWKLQEFVAHGAQVGFPVAILSASHLLDFLACFLVRIE